VRKVSCHKGTVENVSGFPGLAKAARPGRHRLGSRPHRRNPTDRNTTGGRDLAHEHSEIPQSRTPPDLGHPALESEEREAGEVLGGLRVDDDAMAGE
jgi:hypothetical protein